MGKFSLIEPLEPTATTFTEKSHTRNPQIDEIAAKQYNNLRYNKAALAFMEAGGNDTKNPRSKAVDAVIAISFDDKLWLPCYHFAQTGVPINGKLYEL